MNTAIYTIIIEIVNNDHELVQVRINAAIALNLLQSMI